MISSPLLSSPLLSSPLLSSPLLSSPLLSSPLLSSPLLSSPLLSSPLLSSPLLSSPLASPLLSPHIPPLASLSYPTPISGEIISSELISRATPNQQASYTPHTLRPNKSVFKERPDRSITRILCLRVYAKMGEGRTLCPSEYEIIGQCR